MSFELHQRKHIDGELRSIARRQLRRASDTLRSANANTFDTAVHESRKSVKKVRAIVRVLEESGAAIPRKDRKRLKRVARERTAPWHTPPSKSTRREDPQSAGRHRRSIWPSRSTSSPTPIAAVAKRCAARQDPTDRLSSMPGAKRSRRSGINS